MKVEKIITQTAELEITGATLLSIEEMEKLPIRLRKHINWWWLRTPGVICTRAMYVNRNGSAYSNGLNVYMDSVTVRPALKIKNLKSSNFEVGDIFVFGDKKFEVISEELAFCLKGIGICCFREDWKTTNANDYDKSDVKKFIDEWFEKAKN